MALLLSDILPEHTDIRVYKELLTEQKRKKKKKGKEKKKDF